MNNRKALASEAVDPLVLTAIDWMVRLDNGHAPADVKAAFERWIAASDRHQQAWQEMTRALQPASQLQSTQHQSPAQLAVIREVLSAPTSPQRRRLLNGMALVLVGLGTAYLLKRSPTGMALTADIATSTAERKTVILGDGSQLTLDAESAIDIHFSAGKRWLTLHAGACIVQVAADPARPFTVATSHGSVTALGTRFMVRRQPDRSLAVVLQHSVLLAAGPHQQVLSEGESAWFDSNGIAPAREDMRSYAAWEDGVLDVRNQSLGEVVDALRAYRKDYLRVSPAASKLRVFGVFQLDDPERSLRTLAQALPVRITHYGPWLTLIDNR
ncbi:FecR family protein [Methylovorus sp. MP688]|uniref:FecR family protein n=1 Tax=Methylovorus sp. (strain MP688) TaxID=887061 RepID=UPI0001EC4C55|nr:FecR family protein [Methylovorus sp. MP688]ADQ85835.1 anti-FecI sigma factor, FecR [Methylovorus sp. MP688]